MMIIKYFQWLKIYPDKRDVAFELCIRDPQKEEGVKTVKSLDRQTAFEIIEEFDIPKVHSNRHGAIWEREDLDIDLVLRWIKKRDPYLSSEVEQISEQDSSYEMFLPEDLLEC